MFTRFRFIFKMASVVYCCFLSLSVSDLSSGQTVSLLSAENTPPEWFEQAISRTAPPNYIPKRPGLYTRDDWADFYNELHARWSRIRLRVRRSPSASAWSDEEHGRQVLADTTYGDFRAPLGGEPTTHAYFTQGGYHRLADADRVWWSPSHVPSTEED